MDIQTGAIVIIFQVPLEASAKLSSVHVYKFHLVECAEVETTVFVSRHVFCEVTFGLKILEQLNCKVLAFEWVSVFAQTFQDVSAVGVCEVD